MAGCGGGRLNERAFDLAYRYLARRERTVSELRLYLLSKDIDAASAGIVVAELVEQGLLDDARFARLFVQDKRELQQWGSQRIRQGLLVRGIDAELADAALEADGAGEGGGDDLERALALLRQRFPIPPEARRERDRALGMLLRRGYQSDLAIEALHAHRRQEREERAA